MQLGSVLKTMEMSRSCFVINNGNPELDPLYSQIHDIYVQTLKNKSEAGIAEAKTAEKSLADRLASFAKSKGIKT